MTEHSEKHQDEIELIDILRIIWKWKFVILVGILISALIGFAVNIKKSPIYRVSTVLQPGVLRVDERGRKVYIDDPANMKVLIESGTLNDKILRNLETVGDKRISVPLRFKIIMPKRSNILRIYYQTRSAELGVEVLNLLPKILLEEYKSEIRYFEDNIEKDLISKIDTKADLEITKNIIENDIKNMQKLLTQLNKEMNHVNSNMIALQEKKDIIVTGKNNDDIVRVFLYNDNIQKNLERKLDYQTKLFNYQSYKEQAALRVIRLKEKIALILKEIDDIKKGKESLEYIHVLQSPTRNPRPVNPKARLTVTLAVVIGLVFTVFLSFFLEYLLKYRKKIQKHSPSQAS